MKVRQVYCLLCYQINGVISANDATSLMQKSMADFLRLFTYLGVGESQLVAA